jgi:hypothetical protein
MGGGGALRRCAPHSGVICGDIPVHGWVKQTEVDVVDYAVRMKKKIVQRHSNLRVVIIKDLRIGGWIDAKWTIGSD